MKAETDKSENTGGSPARGREDEAGKGAQIGGRSIAKGVGEVIIPTVGTPKGLAAHLFSPISDLF